MIEASEICELDECENQAQIIVSTEQLDKKMRVCHECVTITMSMENLNESVDIN